MGIHRAWLQGLLNIPIIDPCWAGVAMAAGALGILKNN
jgi:Asp/Glu/hydantoin racemase